MTELAYKSLQDRTIEHHSFGSGKLSVLAIGGVHGNESEGFLFLERFMDELTKGNINLDSGITLHICPRINPDGCAVLRRTNQNNVDLNRNLPTKDWSGEFTDVRYFPGKSAGSEVESEITIDLIQKTDPSLIISMHSYEKAMVNYNGDCENLANAMGKKNGLVAKGDIGYPTPGSLGTYTGWERNLPTITLEILRGQEPGPVWDQHLDGFMDAVHFYLKNPLPERKNP
ncbi:MAG: DUF2817 domain-containing protein [Spirochaetia bacterium]|nr:DUF2817 domain-containing protein [Spirochaetia bacterium]